MTNFLIDFIDSATVEEIITYLEEHNCTLMARFSKLKNVCHVQSLVVPPKTALVDDIQNDDGTPLNLLSVIPVVQELTSELVNFAISIDQNWWKSYSLKELDFAVANIDVNVRGENVNVYIVDSGIKIDHSEFTNKNISLIYSVTGEFSDTTGHGTALSSLILGNQCSLTDTSLKVVKVFDVARQLRQSDLLYAFNAILDDLAVSANKVSVVNLSWSIPRNTYIEDKILQLIQAGAVVVASAGNSGIPIGDVTPAAMPEVLTIGSYNVDFVPSNFSDYTNTTVNVTPNAVNSGELDSWAPGENIWSAALDGGYGFINGTSASAAIYSASVAYNYSRLLFNNDLGPGRRAANNVIITGIVSKTDRIGILNLSDPRYAASQNKICTYLNTEHLLNAQVAENPGKIVVKPGEVRTFPMFTNSLTASYELLTPMPEYAMEERGILFVKPINEPVGDGVEVSEIHYKINSLDGSIIQKYITVVVVATTFNPDILPTDDPLIEMTLQVTCGGRYTCAGTCTTSGAACLPIKAFSFCGCISL